MQEPVQEDAAKILVRIVEGMIVMEGIASTQGFPVVRDGKNTTRSYELVIVQREVVMGCTYHEMVPPGCFSLS